MADIAGAIRETIANYNNAVKSAGVLFGTVKTEEPLSIELDTKITLPKRFLAVAQHLTDYEIPYNILSEERATHRDKLKTEFTEVREIDDFYVMHEGRQDVQVGSGSLGNFNGRGTVKLLNHLMEGDRVILLRMEGGNMYIVMDRIGEKNGG